MDFFKKLAARLPNHWQSELKRAHFRKQIKNGRFITDEPEYKILPSLINAGDWVLDVGANVGHYTKRLSELVGAQGRVIAFEPIPTTFALLSANTQLFSHPNVSLINAAVSDKLDIAGMSMPILSTGLANYYQAHISSNTDEALPVLTIPVDSLCIEKKIALIKIDAEGHEAFVISGMQKLIAAWRPILIVETGSEEIISRLSNMGYGHQRLEGSPNILFKPNH